MTLSTLSKTSIAALTFASLSVSATIVEFTVSNGTSIETFKVNLHDETTPITVTNFLEYVSEGDYNNTIIHRTVDNFIVQGGGAKFEGTLPPVFIETRPVIQNEPVFSNVLGTIAMAKVAGNENSATSQWFINLADNSADRPDGSVGPKLDTQNGGFTVFGEIIENGMTTINTIASIPRCDINSNNNSNVKGTFSALPMPNYSASDCANKLVPGVENFITITSVNIADPTVNTASSLTPIKNTLLTVTPPVTPTPTPTPPKSSSGSGSIAWFGLAFTALISIRRFLKK
jgi:peptidyl-prolyl cis-trans isomerase A (cyclophilin A)